MLISRRLCVLSPPPPGSSTGLACLVALLFLASGCESDLPLDDALMSSPNSGAEVMEYHPPIVDAGVLVFQSQEDADVTLDQLKRMSFSEFEMWENSQGIKTIFGEFNRIILAEDALNDYYFGLPEDQQAVFRNGPELHSDTYHKGLKEKVIQIVDSPDGSYFDYAVTNPAFAPIISKEGFVQIGDLLYQFKDDVTKIMHNGNTSDLESLALTDKTLPDKSIIVLPRFEPEMQKDLTESWTTFRFNNPNNWETFRDYRWRVWVDGHSEPKTLADDDCILVLSCTFVIRSEAQKKNLWGNYRYTSNFSPPLTFDNTWSYSYSRYNDAKCGIRVTPLYSVPNYSCTGAPNYNCPTSPSKGNYPTTNNGFFYQTPHGDWTAPGPYYPNGLGYYRDAYSVSGVLTATYNDTPWNLSYQ